MDIRRNTEEKVFSYLERHHMISPHDHVILGVSGGADSVCLLFVLLEYVKRTPFQLSVVHVDHGIRPDAGEDAGYVEELCRKQGIPFYLVEADVKGCARREKCSEEDAGRRLRYEAFRRIAEETGAEKVAVAHNCNDRAETMLFHLFRGSGLKGLCGIRPVRREIIRPLLCLERREIEDYLTARRIAWRTDSTNETDDHARNRIRHHIFPYVEQEIVRGCAAHMAQTADILAETEEYMEQQARLAGESCVRKEEGRFEISVEAFRRLHPAIQKRLLHLLAEELSPTGKDILAVHIEAMRSLFEGTGSRRVSLPMEIEAIRSYTKVILGKNREYARPPLGYVVSREQLSETKGCRVDLDGRGMLEFTLLSGGQYEEVPRNRYTKWFDHDKIKESICVRYRETGDFLSIAGEQGQIVHKSLKEHMIGEKIPREDRESVPLLTEGSHVLWVVGGRISEYYKVNRNTKRILQVQLKQGSHGGETEDEDE
ncbi:MAG: tRNA lysidine(34) synthetase TilS [Lachnospiraceae bacterium]|nr:tRNA lysidine(34) synthetase TilS [Lachnospiraceae bacterium]MCM1240413.1 tRNA lysidine(34) synthetase TilS [Lachnospiraceae bacterium]